MDSIGQNSVVIDEEIEQRIAALVGEGRTASDLANDVLRSFVEEAEGFARVDTAEDERRWQEYKRTGKALSAEDFFAKLDKLEARADAKIRGS